jgi:transposase
MLETPVSRRRRRYDAEFKQNAVGLVQSGRPIKAVAFDLGISTWTLRDWIHRQQTGRGLSQAGTLTSETPEQRENRRLRQENDYLRVQRDILKKALAIVSDGHLNSASNS